jgi:hypothetical protein
MTGRVRLVKEENEGLPLELRRAMSSNLSKEGKEVWVKDIMVANEVG